MRKSANFSLEIGKQSETDDNIVAGYVGEFGKLDLYYDYLITNFGKKY